jgi:CDP-4-dehydro-6-deoxyglucose reductase
MPLISMTNGRMFNLLPGMTLLNAASDAGIAFPYSCKTGRCNSCKCRVLEGKTRAVSAEKGLTEQESAEGWILSCVRTTDEDTLIEIEYFDGISIPPAKTFPCRISEINSAARDVIVVKLRLPPSAHFEFIPGQYIDIIGPKGVCRSYSLANSSFADKELELHVKRVANGALSEYWFNAAKVDDLLRFKGPLGTFFLRDVSDLDLTFFATGTGIAPVLSILGSLSNLSGDRKPRSVKLFWGGRTKEDLYLEISSASVELEYVPVLSRADSSWAGARGYVQNVFLSRQQKLDRTSVYACGSDEMIRSSRNMLLEKGLPSVRFFSDAFVCSAAELSLNGN